jgi:hypothetical protein
MRAKRVSGVGEQGKVREGAEARVRYNNTIDGIPCHE